MSHVSRPLAIVNFDFRSSGTVAKSIQIAAACQERGLPVELWAMKAMGPLIGRVPPGIPIVEISRRRNVFGRRTLNLALDTPAFARAIRRRRPCVLLSGGNHVHLTARWAVALSGMRRSVRFGVRASNSSRRPDAKGRVRTKMPLLDRLKFSGADFVVAVSQELAAEIGQMCLGASVACIPNGVDLSQAEQRSAEPFDHPFLEGRQHGTPVIVSVGRPSRQKGFDLLLQALALLPSSTPATALIVGAGKPERLASLHALAAELGISERVDFLGFLDNPFAVMARADLFVNASRWEGSSNALLEALACGLPLVATDCPAGNREVIEIGQAGTLAPVEDPQGLASAIVAELSVGRSREVQKAAAQHWDLGRCVEAWADLLQDQYSSSCGTASAA